MEIDKRDDAHLLWTDVSRRKHSSFGIFDVYTVLRRSPRGGTGSFVLVDAPEWVTIIPITDDEEPCFLMARQYRHGSSSVTLEFPAGAVNAGEAPLDAAKRELLEETGCSAVEMEHLGAVNPNPAFMTNTVHTFLARGLTKIAPQALDQHEILDIERIPVKRVIEHMGNAPYSNGIMMISLAWYLRRHSE
jgi:ADP-ribose pyrophosphatase